MTTYESVLDALGDPTRRAIIDRLRHEPCSVARLAEQIPVSRPAISQHLKVLREARLVTHEPRGTRHIYRVDRSGLDELRGWLEQFWTEALDAFADHVRRIEAAETFRQTEARDAFAGPVRQTEASDAFAEPARRDGTLDHTPVKGDQP